MKPRLLEVDTRVRHKRHPELTGQIKAIEYQDSGEPSAIPYNIDWDDNDWASDALGWFWIYASEDSIEPLPINRPARTLAPTRGDPCGPPGS